LCLFAAIPGLLPFGGDSAKTGRMNWRPCLQTDLTSLAAAIISLLVVVPASFAKEPVPAEEWNQFLLKHPQPHLSWATWKIVGAQEKATASPLQAELLILVEKGVIKSVAIEHSTGFEAADVEVAHWVLTKWRFRPEITHSFTLPVSIIDRRVLRPGDEITAKPITLSHSDIANGKKAKIQNLLLNVDVDHGKITNITVIESSGNPKIDAGAVRWVTKNWLFANNQTGRYRLPVTFSEK
jgi:hypothetical protein